MDSLYDGKPIVVRRFSYALSRHGRQGGSFLVYMYNTAALLPSFDAAGYSTSRTCGSRS